MSALRSLLVLLMLTGLLPLGAYRTMHSLSVAPSGWTAVQDGTNDLAAVATPHSEAQMIAPKRCNGPGLPGSPCSASLGMPPDPATVPEATVGQVFASETTALPKGRNPSGFLDPPRLG